MYAQTNIQLYNQLERNGYSGWELSCVRNAYELAMHLSTCLYRPSGKTNIAHFVGTASILSSLRAPVEVVAAGLLHSIYFHGDFGSIRKGMLSSRRKQIRDAVGHDVEEYIARYTALQWNPQTIPEIRNKLHELDTIDRYVVLMHLADWLEDHLDRGILYCPNAEGRLKYTKLRNDIVIQMAEELGFPSLAAELKRIFDETVLSEIPVEIRSPIGYEHLFLIAPNSYRRSVSAYQELALQYLRRQLYLPFKLRRFLPPKLRRFLRRLISLFQE